MMNMTKFSRRRFLAATATASGGLLMAFHLPVLAQAKPFAQAPVGDGEINAWLMVNADNTVVIRVAQSEMGQGVFTSMPMIVAEELEADWSLVRAEYADANRHIRENLVYQRMSTGGSGAVRRSREYLQQAGAEARERLVRAAAEQWGVEPGACRAQASHVHHDASGRKVAYGAIAAAAAQVSLEGVEIPLKTHEQFKLLGTSPKRLDTPAKVDGSAVFGADVRVPGMVYAAVRHCPVIGGTLKSHDAAAIAGRRGVLQTVALPAAVAVVADSYWRAQQALAALPVEWDFGAGAGSASTVWEREFMAALDGDGAVAEATGDATAAFEAAATVVEGDYLAPYLAHACMEPLNCTVAVTADRVDVWVGTQNPESALATAAEASGFKPEQCYVHTCYLGGGFGRRSQGDFVREAVLIAKAVGKPVQLLWSREEDTRGGQYRPMSAFRFRAALDADGTPTAYHSHTVTHSILASLRAEAVANGVDPSSVEGLTPLIYSVPNREVLHTIRNTHLSTWFWRAVGASQNGWALESFIDEMAVAAKADPIEFRRGLLKDKPSFVRLLDKLADASGWGRALPAGTAQGVAMFESFGSVVGQVAEVSVSKAGQVKVERVVSVVDCGHVVNPLTIEMQVESSIVYGLTAALYGKLTVENGQVREGNFDTYRMLSLADTPVMETHLSLSRGEEWGGIGEPALPPVASAVCNAIFRATGKRVRRLPIVGNDLTWA
jgi:isoquinoline 1-oxidoreductase subunit beta